MRITEDDDLSRALAEANAAMAEHEQLKVLEGTLGAEHIAATSEQQHAAAVRDRAEADCLLAALDPKVSERAQTARGRAQEADAALARIENAQRALPAKLAETDERIAAAAVALEQTAAPVCAATLADFETEMRGAVAAFCEFVQRGYALAAAGIVASRYLDEITIPSPVPGATPLLADGRSTTNGSPAALNTAWRESEPAVALHEEYAPVHRTAVQLKPHLLRIEDVRTRSLIAANAEGRRQAFDRTRGSITTRPAHVAAPPAVSEQPRLPPAESDWLTAARGHR